MYSEISTLERMKTCKRCLDRKVMCKELCNRCYYAERRGYETYGEIKARLNRIEDGVGILETTLGEKFIVDVEEFEKCSCFIWSSTGHGYARHRTAGYLHRFIRPEFDVVDHVNRDKKDNRKSNLRRGRFINVLNTDKRNAPQPIRQNKRGGWYARFQIEGKRHYIHEMESRDDVKAKVAAILRAENREEFYNL